MDVICARRVSAAITGPRFWDYIPQRMRGMATDNGPLRPVPTRCLKFDVFLFFLVHWNTLCTIILRTRSIDCNG